MSKRDRIIKTLYYTAIGLFSALFIGSALLTVIDTQGSYNEFRRLSFPDWLLYPTSLAKVLGIAAILRSSSRSLKDFAFAGFLYDLLLAIGAHTAVMELFVLVPIFSVALWLFAYIMDRIYHDGEFAWFWVTAPAKSS